MTFWRSFWSILSYQLIFAKNTSILTKFCQNRELHIRELRIYYSWVSRISLYPNSPQEQNHLLKSPDASISPCVGQTSVVSLSASQKKVYGLLNGAGWRSPLKGCQASVSLFCLRFSRSSVQCVPWFAWIVLNKRGTNITWIECVLLWYVIMVNLEANKCVVCFLKLEFLSKQYTLTDLGILSLPTSLESHPCQLLHKFLWLRHKHGRDEKVVGDAYVCATWIRKFDALFKSDRLKTYEFHWHRVGTLLV